VGVDDAGLVGVHVIVGFGRGNPAWPAPWGVRVSLRATDDYEDILRRLVARICLSVPSTYSGVPVVGHRREVGVHVDCAAAAR
jgi:hypothetical protein